MPRFAANILSLSEQRQLIALLWRRAEQGCVEGVRRARRKTEAAAGAVEAGAEHVGVRPGPGHPLRPGRIVKLAAVTLRDQRQDVRGLLRLVLLEPFLEQPLQLERQPQQRVTGDARPGL